MQTKHKTSDGSTLFIFEMEDSHLVNTIKIFCGNISTFREILDNPKEMKKSEKILYGDSLMSESEAANKLASLTDKLAAYVFEAAIRGLNISEMLQVAYGRKTSMIITNKIDF